MQPILKSPVSPVVNWSILGRLIGQLPAAVVVVNGPPFRGPLITCRPHHLYWPLPLPIGAARCSNAAVGYVIGEPVERIARQMRHGSTAANRDALSPGGAHVLP